MANRGRGTWVMFAVLAVGVVGLTGVFATYATPLPLQRAMAREAALDAALATAAQPDPGAAMAALASRLGDSADALKGAPAGLADRVAGERLAMRARFGAEAEALAAQVRLLVIVVTAMAALFVAVTVAGFSRRR